MTSREPWWKAVLFLAGFIAMAVAVSLFYKEMVALILLVLAVGVVWYHASEAIDKWRSNDHD
jgi:uncharacterized membrane protein